MNRLLTNQIRRLATTQARYYSTVGKKHPKVLITGSNGQIGSELIPHLREKYGKDNIIATDIGLPKNVENFQPFYFLNVLDHRTLKNLVKHHNIDWIIHNGALLSAVAERNPELAMELNTKALHNVLDIANEYKCRLFVPSSIAAFGTTTPLDNTPNVTIQRPESLYGIGKVYAEHMGEYYYQKKGLDFRSLRYPGIISYKTLPGGGTTDYAIDMFHYALRGEKYECYIDEHVPMPMMYMDDCIKATVELMERDEIDSPIRAFNVTAMSFTPAQLVEAIRKHYPDFEVEYKPDNLRNPLAKSWPNSLDDSEARRVWNWQEDFDLDAMVSDMFKNLKIYKEKGLI
mmetsp:Transcript_2936/g.4274  ORF Transcript_2936/g.4274 Transcript_2936/m.4274 type:complete len:344 (+) Transcript_2936:47-1078(+)